MKQFDPKSLIFYAYLLSTLDIYQVIGAYFGGPSIGDVGSRSEQDLYVPKRGYMGTHTVNNSCLCDVYVLMLFPFVNSCVIWKAYN